MFEPNQQLAPGSIFATFKDYALKRRWAIGLLYFFTLILYLPKIANFSYSIDSELFVSNPRAMLTEWLGIGRFGLVALKRLFLIGTDLDSFFINTTTYFLLGTSAVLLVFLIDRQLGVTKISVVLGLIYLSSPIHFEQTDFILQSTEVTLAFVALFFAFILMGQPTVKIKTKTFLTAIVITTFSFSVYPSLILGYLALAILLNLIFFLSEKGSHVKLYVLSYLKFAMVFLASVILYELLNFAVIHFLHVPKSSYITSAFGWGKESFGQTLAVLASTFKLNYLNLNPPFYLSLMTYSCILAVFVTFIKGTVSHRHYWPVIGDLLAGYVVSISLLLMLGDYVGPVRTMTPSVPIILVGELLTIAWALKDSRIHSYVVLVFSLLIIFQSKITYDLEQTDILQYQAASHFGDTLVEAIQKKGVRDFTQYQLVVVGKKTFTSPLSRDGDVIGNTSWNWDYLTSLSDSRRIQSFLNSQGYPFMPVDQESYDHAVRRARSMSPYPANNSIYIGHKQIVVKLDN
ncbi:glucosyltransferase domain-containing protein [Lacticaseibacillus sp. 866-1]|uniref:glucosyltransferase domain-containing protein n=1 Tax=Lacticaseibacillus sp. 866-1 TaxID=2799576 RepID=UPI001943C693|nr:glucosyltransferase domain-containing protein [Lacticaseibacillus sp. 866-1]